MRWQLVGIAALMIGATESAGAQRANQGRPCLFVLDHADRQLTAVTVFGDNQNFDVAGDVHMHCRGQPVTMVTDSLSVISGDYFRFFGHTIYRDPSYEIRADTLAYIRRNEKLEARGHVMVRDRASGSTLTGPAVDYYRAVKGINDSARVLAYNRPTVRYVISSARDSGTAGPVVLTGAVIHGFGESRLLATGDVLIERDALRGTGDSLLIQQGTPSIARLFGDTANLHRRGPDSLDITSRREIRMTFDGGALRELTAYRDARIQRAGTELRGDTARMEFAQRKLSALQIWSGDSSMASMHSAGFDVSGDSIAVDSPAQILSEVRVFGDAKVVSPRDSTSATVVRERGDTIPPDSIRNTLWGDKVVATFTSVDSAGTTVARITGLRAFGAARSLFARTITRGGKATPSINYTRADTVIVVMIPGDSMTVASVQAFGHVDGVQLETASLRKAPKDTSQVPSRDTTRGGVPVRPSAGPPVRRP